MHIRIMNHGVILALLLAFCLPSLARAGSLVEITAPEQVGIAKPFLIRVASPYPLAGITVRWNGRTVRPTMSWEDGKSVAMILLGVGLRQKTGVYTIDVRASVWGQMRRFCRSVEVVESIWDKEVLRVPQKMVTPPVEALVRIARERRLVRALLAEASPWQYWKRPFFRPAKGKMLSRFGLYRIFNGKTKARHTGLDFRAWEGTSLYAMAEGKVVLTGNLYYAGNAVFINHGGGFVSMACHMSKILVREGDMVVPGQVIGLSGATGRVNGAHLHLSTFVLGKAVDPELFFTGELESVFNESTVFSDDKISLKIIRPRLAPLWVGPFIDSVRMQ